MFCANHPSGMALPESLYGRMGVLFGVGTCVMEPMEADPKDGRTRVQRPQHSPCGANNGPRLKGPMGQEPVVSDCVSESEERRKTEPECDGFYGWHRTVRNHFPLFLVYDLVRISTL